MTEAYVALGSNLGDREQHLRSAVTLLGQHPLIEVARVSPVYVAKAHTLEPDEQGPDFLNAVAHLHIRLTADELLLALREIELSCGRDRDHVRPWSPRTLDLDLLLYGQETIQRPDLSVPHPRMGKRRFVLQPLADLAPDRLVPEPFQATVSELLDRCPDPDRLMRTDIDLNPDPHSLRNR
jgi:2-amino-4-hydroxy-6-hydroxymethyldihydropteridine diphosphokinase